MKLLGAEHLGYANCSLMLWPKFERKKILLIPVLDLYAQLPFELYQQRRYDLNSLDVHVNKRS